MRRCWCIKKIKMIKPVEGWKPIKPVGLKSRRGQSRENYKKRERSDKSRRNWWTHVYMYIEREEQHTENRACGTQTRYLREATRVAFRSKGFHCNNMSMPPVGLVAHCLVVYILCTHHEDRGFHGSLSHCGCVCRGWFAKGTQGATGSYKLR